MKKFWITLFTFVLKMVDVDISLNGDVLTVVLEMFGAKVVDLTIDLIKDDGVKSSGEVIAASLLKNSRFASTRTEYARKQR